MKPTLQNARLLFLLTCRARAAQIISMQARPFDRQDLYQKTDVYHNFRSQYELMPFRFRFIIQFERFLMTGNGNEYL